MSSREYRARLRGNSWKEKLAKDIEQAMEYSGNRDDFVRAMTILGYRMTWTDERKYLTFHCPNGRSCRDIKLQDEKYLKDNIERELLQREFPGEEKQPTGWKALRELYEQHLRERAQSKVESQRISDSYSNISSEISSLAGAVSKIVDNDSEDPTSAASVLKQKKTVQHSVQLSDWVSALQLISYPIIKKNRPRSCQTSATKNTKPEKKSSTKSLVLTIMIMTTALTKMRTQASQ